MKETATMPPIRAHVAHRHAGPFVRSAKCPAVEPGLRIEIQRRTSQGDQRGNRRVDVDHSRTVQRQLDALIVLVLFHKTELPACSGRQHDEDNAEKPPEGHNSQ